MFELTVDNAADYLRHQGQVHNGPVEVEVLGGGVSNAVFRVRTPDQLFVLKQSRPQLRTRDAWHSDLDRVYREQAVMELLYPHLPPLTVPEVLFADRANYLFAMSHAPAPAVSWKEDLLKGTVDLRIGALAGVVLGELHQATADRASSLTDFRDRTVFWQLRIDPFYRRVQQRRPEVAEAIEPLIERMQTTAVALCHGDYTPKNMLVHASGFTLVDYETAHLGDPTMDLGLFLTHLLLKSIRLPAQRSALIQVMQLFWDGYARAVRFRSMAELAADGIKHLGACLLARIDGTSPVEYITDEAQRDHVRRLGRHLLLEQVTHWPEVLAIAFAE